MELKISLDNPWTNLFGGKRLIRRSSKQRLEDDINSRLIKQHRFINVIFLCCLLTSVIYYGLLTPDGIESLRTNDPLLQIVFVLILAYTLRIYWKFFIYNWSKYNCICIPTVMMLLFTLFMSYALWRMVEWF